MVEAPKHDVRTIEGRDAARELVRLARTDDPLILQQVGADAPPVILQLLDELQIAEQRYHGMFGAEVAKAAREYIIAEYPDARKLRFEENVTVRSMSVHIVKGAGKVVVDMRLEVDP